VCNRPQRNNEEIACVARWRKGGRPDRHLDLAVERTTTTGRLRRRMTESYVKSVAPPEQIAAADNPIALAGKLCPSPNPPNELFAPSSDDRRPYSPHRNSLSAAFLPPGSRAITGRRRFPARIRPVFTSNPPQTAKTGKTSQLNGIQ
jgi:hypothetical protein